MSAIWSSGISSSSINSSFSFVLLSDWTSSEVMVAVAVRFGGMMLTASASDICLLFFLDIWGVLVLLKLY